MELLQHRSITNLGHAVALRLAVVGRTVRRARTSRPREGGERGAGSEDDEGEDKMFEPEGRPWQDQAFAAGADEEVEDRRRRSDEGEHEGEGAGDQPPARSEVRRAGAEGGSAG